MYHFGWIGLEAAMEPKQTPRSFPRGVFTVLLGVSWRETGVGAICLCIVVYPEISGALLIPDRVQLAKSVASNCQL